MSKHRRNPRMTNFVALERYLLQSPAWASLPPAARAAYIAVAHGYTGSNNGYIRLSALALSQQILVGRSTAGRALAELVQKGFIEVAQPGGFNIKSGARATEWRLTAFRCDRTSTASSKAFMRWRPEMQNAVPPQSNCGPTTEQLSVTIGKDIRGIAPTRDRKGHNRGCRGPSTEHHLEYNHMGRPQQRGDSPATQQAGATSGMSIPVNFDFVTFGGGVLKSMADLDLSLPDDFRSWKPLQNPSPKILRAQNSAEASRAA